MNLYVVVNSDGQFFRSKGFGGYGKTWVAELEKARFYTKLGQAKSRVTWFAREYPEFPAPSIAYWELDESEYKKMDMADYAKKAIKKIEDNKEKERIRHIDYEIKRLEQEKSRNEKSLTGLRIQQRKP